MKYKKLASEGFSHLIILVGIIVIAVIIAVFYSVMKAHDKTTSANLGSSSKSLGSQSSLSSSAQTKSGASTVPTTTPTSSSSSSTSAKATSTASKTTTSSSAKGSASSSGSSSSSASSSQTPLSVLTGLIATLDNGGLINITSTTVTVAGPITDATAQPIVFTANGQTYYAYTQESPPNFNTSAAQTAGTMAITIPMGSVPTLTQGHLSKTNNLVNLNSIEAGYSTGGD